MSDIGVGDSIHFGEIDIVVWVYFGELLELGSELLAKLASTSNRYYVAE